MGQSPSLAHIYMLAEVLGEILKGIHTYRSKSMFKNNVFSSKIITELEGRVNEFLHIAFILGNNSYMAKLVDTSFLYVHNL